MNLQMQYDEQIETVFSIRKMLGSLNNKQSRLRSKLQLQLMKEKEKAEKLDAKITEERFPLFKAQYIIKRHNSKKEKA